MRKKSLVALVLLFACIMSLLAAGISEEKTEVLAQPTEHESVTLMDAQRDYRELVKLVAEKYPEINIEIEPYRGRNMSAYCKQQLETGIMPDIYSSTQAWDAKYQKENLIDLSQYAVTELYNNARLSEYIIDGGVYLLPFDFSITGFLCNKSLLDRNGIAVPTSFAQMRDETIPALKEKGIKVATCLLDLPGSAFQFFFDVCAGEFMNLSEGRKWRSSFIDTESDTWASNNEKLQACVEYFQQWIDCGFMVYGEESPEYSSVIADFTKGNTAFLVGTVKQFSQYTDGTGDQYVLLPWFSEDGENNTYITSPSRFYGLNKELLEPGNEQKLQDALHVLEVLSTNEGYYALNGENSTNLCSINSFKVFGNSPYAEAAQSVSRGYAMNLVYTGWDSYLVPFGEAVLSWIKGEITGQEALEVLDNAKKSLRDKGVTSYATVTEELDTVQAAQLSGQMFLEATGADAALISYNVYSSDVAALMENSYGANGRVLPGELTEEYITIFLPTGWYDTLQTIQRTGKEIKEMAAKGADTRNTGFYYPYVFMTADGQPLKDEDTYTVVICGHTRSERATLGLVDTGIVGLDAAKEYLLKVGEVSTKTLDESLVQSVGFVN
jgi:raffinose/stachyose/melibiose transport system substrate-binding protein